MTTPINSLTGRPPAGRTVHDSRVVKNHVPTAVMQRARDSRSPALFMAGPKAMLAVDRRILPVEMITTIVEDKHEQGWSLIYMSREAGHLVKTHDEDKATQNIYIRVPFSLEQILGAFMSIDAFNAMVYEDDYEEEPAK